MTGTLINCALIIAGSLVGLLLKKGIPDRIQDTVIKGIGLCVLYLGFSGALKITNALYAIVAFAVGGMIGEALDLDGRVGALSGWAARRFAAGDHASFAQGLTQAFILFCSGGMAVYGPLQSALANDNSTLISKGVIDGISAVILASRYGVGVVFSSIPVLLYQGLLALVAGWLQPVLNEAVVANLTGTGSIILLGVGLNMLGAARIKAVNYVPAMLVAVVITLIFK
mgnify:CR=1 FL=1